MALEPSVSCGQCALPRRMPLHPDFLVPGLFPLPAPEAVSREITWTSSLPPGNAALYLGAFPAGDPRDITDAEP